MASHSFKGPRPRRSWPVLLACAIVVGVAYWLCLRFAFPGYFAPLSAFHGDFYEYASLRNKPLERILRYPRPAAYFCMKVLGQGGLYSEMAGGIAVALLNIWLTIVLAARFLGRVSWALPFAAAVYCVALFAHPDFYFEHRHDLPAEVSYLFLLCALLGWSRFAERRDWVWAASAVICAVLFVFSKETYFASAPLLLAGLALADRGKWKTYAAFGAVLVAIEAAGFLWTAHLNGPFVNTGAAAENVYKIDISAASIARTAWFYLSHLFTPFLALPVGGSLVLLRRHPRLLGLAAAFALAGLCAVGPHALLPNHLTEEYAWAGAPFLLAPVLIAAGEAVWPNLAILAALAALAVFGPWSYRAGYQTPELAYNLIQDQIGASMAKSVAKLHRVPTGSKVLVVGLDATYVPFFTESFLLEEFGEHVYWTLLTGPGIAVRKPNRVTGLATVAEVELDDYNFLATYESDGNLKGIRDVKTIGLSERAQPYLLVPGLRIPAALTEIYPKQPHRKFIAAGVCLDWGLWNQAQTYLSGALQNGGGNDPTYRELTARLEKGMNERPTARKRSGTLAAEPARITDTDGTGLAVTEIVWTVSPPRACEIHVDSPAGKLFALAFDSGRAKTQKWVRNGTKFFLQDVSAGRGLTSENTLAEVTVEVTK